MPGLLSLRRLNGLEISGRVELNLRHIQSLELISVVSMKQEPCSLRARIDNWKHGHVREPVAHDLPVELLAKSEALDEALDLDYESVHFRLHLSQVLLQGC